MARMAKDFSELKGILQNMVRESAEAIADRAEDVFKTEIRRKYDVQYPRERDEDGEPGWFLHSNKQKYLLSRVKGSDIKVETLDKDDKGFVIGIKPDNL